MTRINNRQENQMRPIEIEIGVNKHAEGSALVKFGDTHVICTATIENSVPWYTIFNCCSTNDMCITKFN